MEQSEEGLVAGLLDAQRKAEALFADFQEKQTQQPVAVVYRTLLSCCCGKHLRPDLQLCLSGTEPFGETGAHGDSILDRERPLRIDPASGRTSSLLARDPALGHRGHRFAPVDTSGLDSIMR